MGVSVGCRSDASEAERAQYVWSLWIFSLVGTGGVLRVLGYPRAQPSISLRVCVRAMWMLHIVMGHLLRVCPRVWLSVDQP